MDSGWAVVLGAVIALTGSALLPWWRESRAAARQRVELATRDRADTLVELLAKNFAMAAAFVVGDTAMVQSAYEARERAGTRLLLTLERTERLFIRDLLAVSIPVADDKKLSSGMAGALQDVMLRWAAGEVPATETKQMYIRMSGLDARTPG
jgi:hypothetical protein